VISLLWLAQKQNDYWLPKPAIEKVAEKLGMPSSGCSKSQPSTRCSISPGRQVHVQMCGTTPCLLAGSDALKKILQRRIGEQGQVTADGAFLLGRSRVPGRLLQCPDGSDQ